MQEKVLPPIHPSRTLLRISKGTMLRIWRNGHATIASTRRKMENRPFAAHALHVATQMFFGLLITGILNLAVMAIVASFFYIFGIEEPKHLYEHIIQFIWFVLAPQVCCTLIHQNEDEVAEPFKVLRLILNFILSPAVIIYTVILLTNYRARCFKSRVCRDWE